MLVAHLKDKHPNFSTVTYVLHCCVLCFIHAYVGFFYFVYRARILIKYARRR